MTRVFSRTSDAAGPVDARPGARGAGRRRPLRVGLSETTPTGRPRSSPSRWRPIRSTAGSRAGGTRPRRSARCSIRSRTRCSSSRRSRCSSGEGTAPAWMVAAIVAREIAVSGLRLAALERGVVMGARDLGKLKTWAQTVAATLAGLQAAGAWDADVAWWALLVATAADVDLGSRLRARRAAGAARRGRRVVGRGPARAPGLARERLGEPGPPPRAARSASRSVEPSRVCAAAACTTAGEVAVGILARPRPARRRGYASGTIRAAVALNDATTESPSPSPSRSSEAVGDLGDELADADPHTVADRHDRGDDTREVVDRGVVRRRAAERHLPRVDGEPDAARAAVGAPRRAAVVEDDLRQAVCRRRAPSRAGGSRP